MGRRRKNEKQKFSFPSIEQDALTDAEIDAGISGVTPSGTAATQAKQNIAKKEIKKSVDEIPEIFTADQVVWMFDVYTAIISFGFSVALKCEYKPIFEELQFDADAKMHMAKPLAKICSKYAPTEWAGMSAEIELVMTLGIYTVAGFGRAKYIADQEKQKRVRENRNPESAVLPKRQAQAVTV